MICSKINMIAVQYGVLIQTIPQLQMTIEMMNLTTTKSIHLRLTHLSLSTKWSLGLSKPSTTDLVIHQWTFSKQMHLPFLRSHHRQILIWNPLIVPHPMAHLLAFPALHHQYRRWTLSWRPMMKSGMRTLPCPPDYPTSPHHYRGWTPLMKCTRWTSITRKTSDLTKMNYLLYQKKMFFP